MAEAEAEAEVDGGLAGPGPAWASHTQAAVGSVRRLSVAVVVRAPPAAAPATAATGGNNADDKGTHGSAADAKGESSKTVAAAADAAKPAAGLSPAEVERMTNLVKEAVGFDATRGDSISITAAQFMTPPLPEPMPEPPMWKQPWVWSIGKQVLGGLFVLFVLFGVVRPTIKSLMSKPQQGIGDGSGVTVEAGAIAALPGSDGALIALPGGQQRTSAQQQLLTAMAIDPNLDNVKQFVNADPRVAAEVIKGWVGD